MSMIKYRIHEVAKDFNVTSKVISQILTDYIAPPKNHMQVLETNELDVIFEYLTQHNQVGSIAEIFAPLIPAIICGGLILGFRNILEKNGVNVTVRRRLGKDIDASCGQLRRNYEKKKELP